MNGMLLTLLGLFCVIPLASAQSRLTLSSVYMMSSFLPPGEKCGPQTISGWTLNSEVHQNASNASPTNNPGNFDGATGIFKPPFRGYFHVCASFRIKKGSHGDFIIVKGNNGQSVTTSTDIQGAFGSACPVSCDWSSHEQCIVVRAGTEDTLAVRLMSGAGTDCAETTSWRYAKLDIFSIAAEE